MNDDDRERMQTLGITVARRNVYSYKEFKYERLDDAIRYAEIDATRDPPQVKSGSQRYRSGPSGGS